MGFNAPLPASDGLVGWRNEDPLPVRSQPRSGPHSAWLRDSAGTGEERPQRNRSACAARKSRKGGCEGVGRIACPTEKGDASAQYNLGVMYANGLGVPKDEVEAVKWYRKAADQG
ncbi:MAG: hypothetical protein EXS19_05920, partial [Pedosphaera sp.]|nr:hypothetical protein [Pedosphaera sp.]